MFSPCSAVLVRSGMIANRNQHSRPISTTPNDYHHRELMVVVRLTTSKRPDETQYVPTDGIPANILIISFRGPRANRALFREWKFFPVLSNSRKFCFCCCCRAAVGKVPTLWFTTCLTGCFAAPPGRSVKSSVIRFIDLGMRSVGR